MLTGPDGVSVLWGGNETPPELPYATVPELFGRMAIRTPEAIAVKSGGETTLYAELNSCANHLARRLAASGVGGGLEALPIKLHGRLPR